ERPEGRRGSAPAGQAARPASRASAPQVLEQDRLEVLHPHASRGRDEGTDLAAPDEPASAELDALEATGARPSADRRWRELDVRGGQDLGRLAKGDPVGGRGHRRQSVEPAAAASVVVFLGVADEPSDVLASPEPLPPEPLPPDPPSFDPLPS